MSVTFPRAAPPALKVKLRLPRSLDAQIQELLLNSHLTRHLANFSSYVSPAIS
jgi:hypothetical protein